MKRHRSARFAGLRGVGAGFRNLFSAAALVAVLLQAFVVQVHVDGLSRQAPPIVRSSNEAASAFPAKVVGAQAPEAACPICEALATGPTALAVAAPSLPAVFGAILDQPPGEFPPAPLIPAHTWQSRAPPALL